MDPIFASVIILAIFALSVVGMVAITHGQNDVAIQAMKTLGEFLKGLPGWPFAKKRLEDKTDGEQAGELPNTSQQKEN